MYESRVAPFPKSFQIGLPTLLVLPMGTLRYHTKNGPHTMHPLGAIGGSIFTTMATYIVKIVRFAFFAQIDRFFLDIRLPNLHNVGMTMYQHEKKL